MRSAASLLLFDDLWSQVEVRATNGGGPGTGPQIPQLPAAGDGERSPAGFSKNGRIDWGYLQLMMLILVWVNGDQMGLGHQEKKVDMYTKNVRSLGGHRP